MTSWKKIEKYFLKSDINVGNFNSSGLNIYKSTINYSLHTKALIIENQRAIFGGINYSAEYIMMNKMWKIFIDFNTVIGGEICNSLLIDFFKIWTSFAKQCIKKEKTEWTKTFIKLYEKINIDKCI